MATVRKALVLVLLGGIVFLAAQFTVSADTGGGTKKPVNAVPTGEVFRWYEVGDNPNDDLIAIKDNRLCLNYYFSEPYEPDLACNVGFLAADIDISVKLAPVSAQYGSYYGVSYRLASPNNRFREASGYYVQLDMHESPNTISLWFGTIQIAQSIVQIPDGYSTLRVVAKGTSHKAFLNGKCVLDELDDSKVDAGHVGVFAWYGNVYVEDFSVTNLQSGVSLFDGFDRQANVAVGFIGHRTSNPGKQRPYIWREAGENQNDDLIAIADNKLALRYVASEPSQPQLACNLGEFVASDIDMTVRLLPESDYYANFYGLAYRLPIDTSVFQDAGGYYVQLDRHESPHKVALWYGETKLADKEVTIPAGFCTLRVVAQNGFHEVYLDGKSVLQVVNDQRLLPGNVGIFAWYAQLYADDFSVTDLSSGLKLSDSFHREDSLKVGEVQLPGGQSAISKPSPTKAEEVKKAPVQKQPPAQKKTPIKGKR